MINQFEVDLMTEQSKEKLSGVHRLYFWQALSIFICTKLTKYGLCEIYNENWERTDKYENLQVNMKVIEAALKSGEDLD